MKRDPCEIFFQLFLILGLFEPVEDCPDFHHFTKEIAVGTLTGAGCELVSYFYAPR